MTVASFCEMRRTFPSALAWFRAHGCVREWSRQPCEFGSLRLRRHVRARVVHAQAHIQTESGEHRQVTSSRNSLSFSLPASPETCADTPPRTIREPRGVRAKEYTGARWQSVVRAPWLQRVQRDYAPLGLRTGRKTLWGPAGFSRHTPC